MRDAKLPDAGKDASGNVKPGVLFAFVLHLMNYVF